MVQKLMERCFITLVGLTHPAHQHRVRSRVLLNDEELIPDPSSFGPVEYLPLLPSPLSVSVQRHVTYKHNSKHRNVSLNHYYIFRSANLSPQHIYCWLSVNVLNGCKRNKEKKKALLGHSVSNGWIILTTAVCFLRIFSIVWIQKWVEGGNLMSRQAHFWIMGHWLKSRLRRCGWAAWMTRFSKHPFRWLLERHFSHVCCSAAARWPTGSCLNICYWRVPQWTYK